ncbi:MAG: [protein-PII] uridylyltransferase [Pseudomonadota bacterium]
MSADDLPLLAETLSEVVLPQRADLMAAITAEVSGAAKDQVRQPVVQVLEEALAKGRADIAAALDASPLAGNAAARAYSTLTETIVATALDAAWEILHPLPVPTQGERLSVLAVGGFGRGEMAPFSDVDLLFLTPYKQTPWSESLIETVLYILWDLKLKVGQSVRTVDDCLRLGQEDITIRTAMLERRLMWGDEALAAELDTRLWEDLFRKTGPEFVEAKLAERDTRHRRQGGSRYLVEPNIKEGKGGLRDLQTLYWLGKYLYNVDTPEALVEAGLFDDEEQSVFADAENFLWSVRSHLHRVAERPVEQLTFDMQVEVARIMGFDDGGGQMGVERFMQTYFRHARAVGELSRIFLVGLEQRHLKATPTLAGRLKGLFRASTPSTSAGFQVRDGRLTIEDQGAFLADPVNLLRLFEEGLATGLLLHPDALRMATRNLDLMTDEVRVDPTANAIFLDMLTTSGDPERALRRMNETGVLGAFIPEFENIVAMMQYNMYHHYTVDEHTISCISILNRIEQGDLIEDLPVASGILKEGVNRRVLYVALLLHDIAKGRPEDHSILGAEMAAKIAPRFGLTPEECDLVQWLVRHHLLMSDVAQKRDIADPRTAQDFANTVARLDRLKLLLVLTVCDIMGVGPGTWNNWKAVLLRQLYRATREVLTGGIDVLERDRRVSDAKETLRDSLSDLPASVMEAEIARHYPPYWVGLSNHTHEMVARMVPGLSADDLQSQYTEDTDRAATQATFVTYDHPGIFSRVAGALALVGANVRDARSYTTSDGIAVSVFWVQDADGSPYEKSRISRLAKTVNKTLRGEVVARDALAPKDKMKRREREFVVPTEITFDNTGSDLFTIIEVDTRDRPGLLHDLTRALAGANVSIVSAIIATYGEQAVDTFYVKDLFGMKLHSETKRGTVERALRNAVMRRPEGTE